MAAEVKVVHVPLVHYGVQQRHHPTARIRHSDGGCGRQGLPSQHHSAPHPQPLMSLLSRFGRVYHINVHGVCYTSRCTTQSQGLGM